MNPLRLTSGYLPFLTLSGRYPSFFWVRVPIGPNFGVFWAITLVKKMSDWAEIWTIVLISIYVIYHAFWKTLIFCDHRTYSKFAVFSTTWAQFIPWRSPKSTKVKFSTKKFIHQAIQILKNQSPIWSQFWITFCSIWCFFVQKWA